MSIHKPSHRGENFAIALMVVLMAVIMFIVDE